MTRLSDSPNVPQVQEQSSGTLGDEIRTSVYQSSTPEMIIKVWVRNSNSNKLLFERQHGRHTLLLRSRRKTDLHHLKNYVLIRAMDSWVVGQIAFWYTVHEVRECVLHSSTRSHYLFAEHSQVRILLYTMSLCCLHLDLFRSSLLQQLTKQQLYGLIWSRQVEELVRVNGKVVFLALGISGVSTGCFEPSPLLSCQCNDNDTSTSSL